MPLDITCYHCGKSFRVSDAVAGKHFRCVGCQGVLKAPEQSIPERPARPIPPPRPPQQAPQPRRSERRNRPASPPPRSRPSQRPETIIEDYDEDQFGYDQPVGASYLDMPGGPVGQPKRKPKRKPKPRAVAQRRANPEAFAEYDRIVNEIAIFWIGLAVIVGGFAGLFYTVFWDGAGDQARQMNLIIGTIVFAAILFVLGLITFTKSKIWLYILLAVNCAFFPLSYIMWKFGNCFLLVFVVANVVMFMRIQHAISLHPQSRR